jgi:formylglycine-generating enzyme required for sulfatase activity
MSLLALLAACAGENSDLIGGIHDAHLNGEDFLGSEEVRVLKEAPAFQSKSQFDEIDEFSRFLADDDLSDIEKKSLIDTFGGATAESKKSYAARLDNYDWHHAWTRSVLTRWQGMDVPVYGTSTPDDAAGARVFKILQERVDLSTLSWENKLAMAETVEGYVIAQYRDKPASALEAIRCYALFEPEGKSVPRTFIEILQSDSETPRRAELAGAIQDWVKTTKNPIVQEELLKIWDEMRINSKNPSEDFLIVLATVSAPESLNTILKNATPAQAKILSDVWAKTNSAAKYAEAWSEAGIKIALPESLRAVFDSEVRARKILEKRAQILMEDTTLESVGQNKSGARTSIVALRSEIESSSDSEFSLWLSAINSILAENPQSLATKDLSFLKPKILAAVDAEVVAQAQTLFALKPDLIGVSDFLILGLTLKPEEIAAHDYADNILTALKEDTTAKSFEAYVKCAFVNVSQISWDEVYAKAVRSKIYTSESLLQDIVSPTPQSKSYWTKLADENTIASAEIIQSLTRLDQQKAFAGILIASKKTDSYRTSVKTWRLSAEVKNLFLDPLAELRGKVPAALLDQLVSIKAGSFTMGSPDGIGDPDEHPQHSVKITKDFYASKFEITNAIWKEVMGTDPSAQYGADFTGADYPVVGVSWNEVQQFFTKLNEKLGANAKLKFRLPTEAEWEYMARAGSTTAFTWGDGETNISRYGNITGSDDGYKTTAPVGRFEKNAFGLYDTVGNVWEWTEDGFGNYSSDSVNDPLGSGDRKIFRGGSWVFNAQLARSALRSNLDPDYRNVDVGFRYVIAPQDSN